MQTGLENVYFNISINMLVFKDFDRVFRIFNLQLLFKVCVIW